VFGLFARRIAARHLTPWVKIKINGHVATVQSVAVCDGIRAPHHLMASATLNTACALLVSFMDHGPIKMHPGDMVVMA
jgi:hypothetical protein